MKRRYITLYVGVIHQKDSEDDYADVRFITMSEEEAKKEFLSIKTYATQILHLECVKENESYMLFKSSDGTSMLEVFYIERILIIKGETNEQSTT